MTALMSKHDVAHYLGVSTKTIDRLAHQRKLEFVLVASRRRFSEDSVRAFVASRSVSSHRPNLSPASSI